MTDVSGMEPVHRSVVVHLVDVLYFIIRSFPQGFPFAKSHLEVFVLYALSDNKTLLLVCVYMPFDTGLSYGVLEYQEALGELEGFLDSQD